jgi:hypothetical protein
VTDKAKTEKELLREIFGEDVVVCDGCDYCEPKEDDVENKGMLVG